MQLCQMVPKIFSLANSVVYFGGLHYVNAEAGTRQTSRCIHSIHAFILRYWYLVRLIKPMGCRSNRVKKKLKLKLGERRGRTLILRGSIHLMLGRCAM